MRFPCELTQSAALALLIGPVVFIYERINNRDELPPVAKEEEEEEEAEAAEEQKRR